MLNTSRSEEKCLVGTNLVIKDLKEIDVMTDGESIECLTDIFMQPLKERFILNEKFAWRIGWKNGGLITFG